MESLKTAMLVIIIGINIANIAYMIGRGYRELERKRQERKRKWQELESRAKLAEAYKKAYQDYKKAYENLWQQRGAGIPEGTVEAVRYAMIRSHPDNGGDPEKFRLYRSCYEKLTGRKC